MMNTKQIRPIKIKVKQSTLHPKGSNAPLTSDHECLACLLRFINTVELFLGLAPLKCLCPHSKKYYSPTIKFQKSYIYMIISWIYIVLIMLLLPSRLLDMPVCSEFSVSNTRIKILEGFFQIIIRSITVISLLFAIFKCDSRIKLYNELAILISSRKSFGIKEVFDEKRYLRFVRKVRLFMLGSSLLMVAQAIQIIYIILKKDVTVACKVYQTFVGILIFVSQNLCIFEFVIEVDIFRALFQSSYENIVISLR